MALIVLAVGLALIIWLSRSAQTRDRSHYVEHRAAPGIIWKFDVRAMRAERATAIAGVPTAYDHFDLQRLPSAKADKPPRWQRRPRVPYVFESSNRIFPTAGLPVRDVAEAFGDPTEDAKWEKIPKSESTALEAAYRRYNDE